MNRVLQLTSNYADAFYKELFFSIEEEGFKNTVFVPQKIGFDDCPNATGVIKSACYTKLDRFLLVRKSNKIVNSVENSVNFKDINLIHAHSLYTCGVPAYFLYRKYGIQYVVSVRYNDVTDFPKYNPGHKKLISSVLENAEAVIFISPLSKRIGEQKFPVLKTDKLTKKSYLIPNKISDFFLNTTEPKNRVFAKPLKIMFVGRLVKNKRLGLLCKHCSKLFNKNDRLVVLTGSDNKPASLLKNYRFIDFVGKVAHEDLPKYYRDADIFALLSKNETFGISYIESISQGTPIIFAKNQAIDGLFEDGKVGYSINAHSYKEFKHSVEKIINNYYDLSKNCIESSKAFSSEKIIGKIVDIYKKAIKNEC